MRERKVIKHTFLYHNIQNKMYRGSAEKVSKNIGAFGSAVDGCGSGRVKVG